MAKSLYLLLDGRGFTDLSVTTSRLFSLVFGLAIKSGHKADRMNSQRSVSRAEESEYNMETKMYDPC